jgi:hypothetical protein
MEKRRCEDAPLKAPNTEGNVWPKQVCPAFEPRADTPRRATAVLVLPICRLSSAQVPRAGCGRMLLAKKDSWLESGAVENSNHSKVMSNHGPVPNQYYKVTVPGGKNTRHSTRFIVECLACFYPYSSTSTVTPDLNSTMNLPT